MHAAGGQDSTDCCQDSEEGQHGALVVMGCLESPDLIRGGLLLQSMCSWLMCLPHS